MMDYRFSYWVSPVGLYCRNSGGNCSFAWPGDYHWQSLPRKEFMERIGDTQPDMVSLRAHSPRHLYKSYLDQLTGADNG